MEPPGPYGIKATGHPYQHPSAPSASPANLFPPRASHDLCANPSRISRFVRNIRALPHTKLVPTMKHATIPA